MANASGSPEESSNINSNYPSCLIASTRRSDVQPPTYIAAAEVASEIFRPDVLETIERTLDTLDGELRELSLKIHDHPEVKFEERYAHDTLSSFMDSHGFKTTTHYLMETAWRAEYIRGTDGRVLGINSEMDALPGIGHACGHNLIAICGVGIALAVKAAMEKHDISGKIVLLGTPAEEGGGGKITLIEKGAYKDMHICLMSHPGPGPKNSVGIGSCLASQAIEVEYHGHSAHAAAAPWEGQNALDAAFLAYSSVSVLRQQIKPSHRVHGVIEGKDWAPNIIPDYAKMRWVARAPSGSELDALVKRLLACIDAAAIATSCKKTVTISRAYLDLRQNAALAAQFANTLNKRYDTLITSAEGAIGGSTDFGNVTYELPAIHPSFAIPTQPNGGNHTALFTDAARAPEAHKATMTITKGLALTGFRALDDDAFYESVRKAFEGSNRPNQ
ncbi:hypothetical protein BD410DRAFT_796184 [Rickenella mellea]|uniref:Peptidase M20 domain-containing protein 2 n=1 Tax=Rickenella mellea TaxID=50990 RepID=A0A4Y7PJK6_9AGAM|nr:hypothetical protein BD410DRAFT_796184 [Rickenella mellea]